VQGLVIGVAGASCSGKTTLAEALGHTLGAPVLKLDDYYRPLCHISYEERCEINFDDPDTIDHELLVEHVRSLALGQAVDTPQYDFTRHTRFVESRSIAPSPVLIVEGLFTFCYAPMVDLCAVRIFVEAPDDVCLQRRLDRDVAERGRTPGEVISRFHGHVWPMYMKHIEPTRQYATVEVSGLSPVDHGLAEVTATIRS